MYKRIMHTITEEHFDEKPSEHGNKHGYAAECENEEDVIKTNVPLMIRLLEYAREDAKKDVELHLVTEKLIELSEEGKVLTMEHYPEIMKVVGAK
jgi:hypothetical protein